MLPAWSICWSRPVGRSCWCAGWLRCCRCWCGSGAGHRADPGVDAGRRRRRHPPLSVVRHRPDHQPDPGLRAAYRVAWGGLCGRGVRRRPAPGPGRWRVRTGRSGPRPWPWPPCSSRLAAASRRSWTGASTAASTTPPRPLKHSVPGCETRSTWTLSRPSCWWWPTRRCSRQRRLCGCDPQHRPDRVAKNTEAEQGPTRLDPLHAMQFRAAAVPPGQARVARSATLSE